MHTHTHTHTYTVIGETWLVTLEEGEEQVNHGY